MPFFGLGLHVLIALFFAIHAVRTGRPIYWLFILFSFPLLGSLVYFIVEYLPGTRLQSNVGSAARSLARSLDPGRELRQAQRAFDLSATVQNRMRLANALLATGAAAEAAQHFDACLQGPFVNDPEIRLGAARARLQNQQAAPALELLDALRQRNPEFRPEQVSLLTAQALAAAGRNEDSRAEFESALTRFDSVEVRANYAIWAARNGDLGTAQRMREELAKTERYWDRHTRSFHQDLFRSVDAALEAGRRGAA
ncbi:MAG TPA: hypothetical protein VH183_13780 [Burkholderiaceae bacterium]|jgi:hypothetical protein|nr:hypothetical protein [Burkholderiaceae bacterium]